jgi:type VI protein secretion system component VasA
MILREHYEREAAALWAHLARLASRYPELEGLYARDADPRVARLVQSAAFAFATAQSRLDDDGQALVRPLVARALPEGLRPVPSSTIVEVPPIGGHSGVRPGARLNARVGGARLRFEAVWPASAAPIRLEDVHVDRLDARRQVLRFALVGRSGVVLERGLPDTVRLFVHLEPRGTALDLVHALRAARRPGRTRWFDEDGDLLADQELPSASLAWVRVDTHEPPIVSARTDRFASGTLLRDLFAFPESFCFLDLRLDGARESAAGRVEVVLPLAHVVEGLDSFTTGHLRLACAPATNQFEAEIEPIPNRPREAVLQVGGKTHAEILEVRRLWATSERDASVRVELRSWEAPALPHRFNAEETYFTLEQRPAAAEERTELRAMFGRLAGMPGAPGGIVEGKVLASDGAITAGLGLGDVGSEQEGAANITRVTPSRRAVLGENQAWRLSAYARMPAGRLADRTHLQELLRLHDRPGPVDDAVRVARPEILHVNQVQEHDLVDGAFEWGDRFTIDARAPGATEGEVWLVGELLHRALSERNEALRFARLVLLRDGAPFAEYAARHGARLPFPLG